MAVEEFAEGAAEAAGEPAEQGVVAAAGVIGSLHTAADSEIVLKIANRRFRAAPGELEPAETGIIERGAAEVKALAAFTAVMADRRPHNEIVRAEGLE